MLIQFSTSSRPCPFFRPFPFPLLYIYNRFFSALLLLYNRISVLANVCIRVYVCLCVCVSVCSSFVSPPLVISFPLCGDVSDCAQYIKYWKYANSGERFNEPTFLPSSSSPLFPFPVFLPGQIRSGWRFRLEGKGNFSPSPFSSSFHLIVKNLIISISRCV